MSQSVTHTPGPWQVHDESDFVDSPSQVICQMWDKSERDFPNKEANARLIAAAPDMLAALKFVKEFFRKMEDHDLPGDPLIELRRKFHAPVHAELDTAIAKAERAA